MHKKLSIVFALVVWFSVVTQFIIMLQNRVTDVPETVIRFFSFFTILTNTIVALYFTAIIFDVSFTNKPGLLTALTSYIFMVGIVYQILLRHLWQGLSGFYPYPFINVVKIGLARALINSGLLTLTFVATACTFILIGSRMDKKKKPPGSVGGFSK